MKVRVLVLVDGIQDARLYIDTLPGRSEESEIQDFKVKLIVSRGGDIVGVHSRFIDSFPVKALNVMALLKTALLQFDLDALVAEDDDSSTPTDSPDMERGLGRTLYALPTEEESRMRNHRSPIRRGQSVEHGGDSPGES